MASHEELTADIAELLEELARDGEIELATKRSAMRLALPLAQRLAADPDFDVEEWLVNHQEVSELYIGGDDLAERIRPFLTRLARANEGPKWNDDLANAITADPDDMNARLVFGDWLQQEGDPRGELIAVQARIAEYEGVAQTSDAKTKAKPKKGVPTITQLRERASNLLARNSTYFLGDLAYDEPEYDVTWWCGFMDEATINAGELLALLSCLSARFLRVLRVKYRRLPIADASEAIDGGAAVLPKTLSELSFVLPENSAKFSIGDGFRGLTRLRDLAITARTITVLHLDFPSLTKLSLRGVSITFADNIQVRMPSLVELHIDFDFLLETTGHPHGLFDEPPPKFTTLRLKRLSSPRAWLSRLASSSKLCSTLRILDLSHCHFQDGDLGVLLGMTALRLDELDLRSVRGAVSQKDALSKLAKNVLTDTSEESDDDDDDDADEDDEDNYDDADE